MKNIIKIIRKELRDYFATPVGYIILGVFSALTGLYFTRNLFIENEASLRNLFDFIPLIWIILIPSITMSSFANERRTGTLELLATLPITKREIIFGKILSNFALTILMLLLSLPAFITIFILGEPDYGQVVFGYIGLAFVAFTYILPGVLISIKSKNQISAYIFSVILVGSLYILSEKILLEQIPLLIRNWVEYLGVGYHYQSIIRGVIDSRDLFYFFFVNLLFYILIEINFNKLFNKGK